MAEPGFVKKDPSRRLAEINRAITTSLNFDEVLDLIVQNAAQLVAAKVSVLLLVDQQGQLRIRAAQGIDQDLIKNFSGRMEEDVVRQLRNALLLGAGEELVSVPVIAKRALNGLLVIARAQPLDSEEQWQLSALADQAAIALRNARLYEMELAEATRVRDETVEALRESREKIVTILESITDLYYSLDKEWRFTDINRQTLERFGKSREELLGKVIWEVFPAAVESALYPEFHEAVKESKPHHFELQSKIVPGRWFEAHVYPTEEGVSAYLRDISERKQAEEEIRFQAHLLDAVEQAVIATDLEGTVIYWNSFAERLFGWSAEEALNANIIDLTPAAALRDQAAEIFSSLRKGQSWSGEFVVKRRDGTEFPALVTDSPIFDDDGQLIGMVGVSVDNTSRRHTEEEREKLLAREQQARAEAEDANRLKDEFLATLSHELRNPLNVVIGYAEILRRSDESQSHAFVVKAADTIRRNALAQSQLVSDLLDLSRLQMGKVALNQQPVSLSTIITDAIETVRAEATGKRITLKIAMDPEILVIEGDPVRLGQVAWNLLNNAVKFTPVDGEVKIELTRDCDDAKLVIEDNGQGISAEFLPHVFEIFRQADASSARRQGGMGIGLALVKQLAELHGGRVSAESTGVGAGARFSVWIPLYKAGIAGLEPEKTGSTGALANKFILVVDDSAETTEMLGKLLQLEGAFVESARSGAEALEIAQRKSFDLVVSDISMPEMDGYLLLRKLRELPSMANVPAVALTGYGRGADVDRALEEGFAEHLTKPLDLDQLLVIVRRLTDANESRT
ncbi:MAG TPA: PAS domain S-box protein [Pyrinomonadaceae bacterium]|nr:PAS domain S-box protein [Pyrinomonadaceae bacterium]